ncbi:hypothetical protein [Thauera aromatica]|uniref:hypothetical protein n=1 Tax=Thauera aromatica TaxID=59405 RepID=UPI001FFD0542|nr:hypothetical protein [Thauera aromatica]MCK2097661.1 hypothetical protein [Thauera aromatica]
MIIKTKFNGYDAGGRRLYRKGGGGSSAKYANLEDLYEEQAASARLLREQAEANLPGAVQSYVDQVGAIQDPGYADRQAGMAGADMASANAMERAATERNLSSIGVNPNDPRFAGSMRSTELNNAARMAAGQNIARNDASKYQLAVAQDAVGTFTGQSNSAATQMGNASSGLGSLYSTQTNQQMAQDQAQSNAIGNAIGGGMAAWSMFKDGGKVKGLGGLSGLKKVERHMLGGQAGSQQNRGFFQMQSIAPPPSAQAPQQRGGISPVTMASMATMAGKNPTIATAADKVGNMVADKAADAYTSIVGPQSQVAQAPVADAVIKPVSEVAAAAPAASEAVSSAAMAGLQEAGLATTAGTVAEGAGAGAAIAAEGGAAAGLMGSVGAALPWVGAAYAVGSLLDLWADGGQVGTQNKGASEQEAAARFSDAGQKGAIQDLRPGGDVPGTWQGNTDNVPAMLTEDEFVLNAEAAKAVGLGALEKLNKKGLQMRKQGKTPDTIKTVGLGALA